jgi:8-oxo-dGTP diphosphatase
VQVRQVTAAVIIEDGRLFLARRPPGDALAGLWELPGGKIEPGETPQECLERELLEELEMKATAGVVVAQTAYEYEHGSFELLAIETTRRSGFELHAHDRCAWAGLDELSGYELAPADALLLEQLRDRLGWGLA